MIAHLVEVPHDDIGLLAGLVTQIGILRQRHRREQCHQEAQEPDADPYGAWSHVRPPAGRARAAVNDAMRQVNSKEARMRQKMLDAGWGSEALKEHP